MRAGTLSSSLLGPQELQWYMALSECSIIICWLASWIYRWMNLLYARLCAGNSEMNKTYPCQQGASGLVGETDTGIYNSQWARGCGAGKPRAVRTQRRAWPSLGRGRDERGASGTTKGDREQRVEGFPLLTREHLPQ